MDQWDARKRWLFQSFGNICCVYWFSRTWEVRLMNVKKSSFSSQCGWCVVHFISGTQNYSGQQVFDSVPAQGLIESGLLLQSCLRLPVLFFQNLPKVLGILCGPHVILRLTFHILILEVFLGRPHTLMLLRLVPVMPLCLQRCDYAHRFILNFSPVLPPKRGLECLCVLILAETELL